MSVLFSGYFKYYLRHMIIVHFKVLSLFFPVKPVCSSLQQTKNLVCNLTPFVQVPISQCSAPCSLGSRQARRPGEPHCCFDCLPCADGEISNQTGRPYMCCLFIYYLTSVRTRRQLKPHRCFTTSIKACTTDENVIVCIYSTVCPQRFHGVYKMP